MADRFSVSRHYITMVLFFFHYILFLGISPFMLYTKSDFIAFIVDKEGFLDSKNLICDTDVLDVRNERDGIIGESSVIQCKGKPCNTHISMQLIVCN